MRVVGLFKATSYFEILLSTIALSFYVYYNHNDWDILLFVLLFVFISMTSANIIGLRIISLHRADFKAKDELIIYGHAANWIKLTGLIPLMVFEGIFFFSTYKAVTRFDQIGILYFLGTISFLVWNILSVFNFIAYIHLSRKNKKIVIADLDNLGL